MSECILLHVAFRTIIALSRQKKPEVDCPTLIGRLRGLFIVHCTLHAFEQFMLITGWGLSDSTPFFRSFVMKTAEYYMIERGRRARLTLLFKINPLSAELICEKHRYQRVFFNLKSS